MRINTKDLYFALSFVGGTVSAKNESTKVVRINNTGDIIDFATMDGFNVSAITIGISDNNSDPLGLLVLEYAPFMKYVQGANRKDVDEISLRLSGNKLVMKAKDYPQMSLPVYADNIFPDVKRPNYTGVEIESDKLVKVYNGESFTSSTYTALAGILITRKYAIASDGYIFRKIELDIPILDQVIVPTGLLKQINVMRKVDSDKWYIEQVDDSFVAIYAENKTWYLGTYLYNIGYPEFEAIFRRSTVNFIDLDKDMLLTYIEAMSIVGDYITMEINYDIINLSVESNLGSSQYSIDIPGGKEMPTTITLSTSGLVKILKDVPKEVDVINIRTLGNNSPIIISCDDRQYLAVAYAETT